MTERTATLLHPRSGAPTAHDSHVGGPMLWPADEPWPVCEQPHMVRFETLLPSPDVPFSELRERFYFFAGTSNRGEGTFAVHYDPVEHEPNPMVGIAQLFARDIPDLACPQGTDMLQVLWCPNEHELDDGWSPLVVLRWRDSAGLTEVFKGPPAPHAVDEGSHYLPKPCTVHPERVTDLPWRDFDEDEDEHEDHEDEDDEDDIVIASGWKVGGHARWNVTDELPTDCYGCGGPTELLLTIDSVDTNETRVEVGRYGALRLFICRACEGMPFRFNIQ